MKRKFETPQIGIRVKNFDSKYSCQSSQYSQSAILSQPFSLSLSNNEMMNQTSNGKTISQSLSVDLISQIQRLNQQMSSIYAIVKQKDIRIQELQTKCKHLQRERKKSLKELEEALQQKKNELKIKYQQIQWKNKEIERYRDELNIHVQDIRVQNKEMITELFNELRVHRQKEVKQNTQVVMQHQRTLKSIQQNSILQRQIQQNSILQKQVQQISQLSIKQNNIHQMSRSPSIKRLKIQKPKFSTNSFKPLNQLIRMNAINDLHQSLKMLSPLTVNIDDLDSKQPPKIKAKLLRREQLQNDQYYRY